MGPKRTHLGGLLFGLYSEAIRREVSAVLRYARVADAGELAGRAGGERGKVVVIPNLLLSYERAYSFVLGDTFYSIEGPQRGSWSFGSSRVGGMGRMNEDWYYGQNDYMPFDTIIRGTVGRGCPAA